MFDRVSKTPLWSVKKKKILYEITLHDFIYFYKLSNFTDIKQTLDQIHLFFMHYCLTFLSHFFAG